MIIQITVTDSRGSEWIENYDQFMFNPDEFAFQLVEEYNKTLRAGERERHLVRVNILSYTNFLEHNWEKTNLITISKGASVFDTAECSRCGATGKRFGLSSKITRDQRFAEKRYERCVIAETYRIRPTPQDSHLHAN